MTYKGSVLMVCHEPDFYEEWATDIWDVSKWTTKICPFCKSQIPHDAVKCPNCTSDLPTT